MHIIIHTSIIPKGASVFQIYCNMKRINPRTLHLLNVILSLVSSNLNSTNSEQRLIWIAKYQRLIRWALRSIIRTVTVFTGLNKRKHRTHFLNHHRLQQHVARTRKCHSTSIYFVTFSSSERHVACRWIKLKLVHVSICRYAQCLANSVLLLHPHLHCTL